MRDGLRGAKGRRTRSAPHPTPPAVHPTPGPGSCPHRYYSFIRPHGSLRFGRKTRTPAQQAGLTTRRLTWRDIFFVPLDRPRQLRVEWLVGRGGEPGRDGRWAFYA